MKSKRHPNKVYYVITEKQIRGNRARAAREVQSENEEKATATAQTPALDPCDTHWKKEKKKCHEQNREKSIKKCRRSSNDVGNKGGDPPTSFNQVPLPWRKEWSDLHNRYYYWNLETHETTWEIPKIMHSAISFWC